MEIIANRWEGYKNGHRAGKWSLGVAFLGATKTVVHLATTNLPSIPTTYLCITNELGVQ